MRASVEIRLESQFSVLLDTTGLLPPSSTVHSGFQPPSPLLGFTDGTHTSSATYHGAHQTSCSVQFATLADSCYPISFSHFASHPNLRKQEENPRMDLRIWFSFVSYSPPPPPVVFLSKIDNSSSSGIAFVFLLHRLVQSVNQAHKTTTVVVLGHGSRRRLRGLSLPHRSLPLVSEITHLRH
ncbi:hypothetical protein L1887_12351 [Cichorium endivia]|nr:hypothetical protein L1887_12351 [Cichorium endivia]